MKYMLMMNTMKAGNAAFSDWSMDDVRNHITFMKQLNVGLKQSGEFVIAEGLTFPDEAKLVRADESGTPITDGVFPESKEFLAGFWIVDVASPERVYQLAAQISAAPGAKGVPLNMPIEVRPIGSPPPEFG